MKLASLILGCLHIPVGFICTLGLIVQLDGRSKEPFWLIVAGLIVFGFLPFSSGILLLKRRHSLSRILGCLLAEVGAFMLYGFLRLRNQGSTRPFWVDLLAVVVVGLIPLWAGILMFRRRYPLVERMVKFACGTCIAGFTLCAASFFTLPKHISAPLSIVAAASLIGGLLYATVWITIKIACRNQGRERHA